MSPKKRKHGRFKASGPVRFSVDTSPINKKEAQVKNVSVEGLCFIVDKRVLPGSEAALEISIGEGYKPVHVQGIIRWCKPMKSQSSPEAFEVGLKITSIAKDDQIQFMAYVCNQMTDGLGPYVHL